MTDTTDMRRDFEAYMLTREAPSSAKKKLAMREGVDYLHEHVARHWFTWQKATKAALPVQEPAIRQGGDT